MNSSVPFDHFPLRHIFLFFFLNCNYQMIFIIKCLFKLSKMFTRYHTIPKSWWITTFWLIFPLASAFFEMKNWKFGTFLNQSNKLQLLSCLLSPIINLWEIECIDTWCQRSRFKYLQKMCRFKRTWT